MLPSCFLSERGGGRCANKAGGLEQPAERAELPHSVQTMASSHGRVLCGRGSTGGATLCGALGTLRGGGGGLSQLQSSLFSRTSEEENRPYHQCCNARNMHFYPLKQNTLLNHPHILEQKADSSLKEVTLLPLGHPRQRSMRN